MTKSVNCVCCKRVTVGKSSVMCDNCWNWHEKEMTMNDISVCVAMLNNREPDNKHAKEICEYLIADNYLHGKATLKEKSKDG